MKRSNRILALALGNDILGDDGVGFVAADRLSELFPEGVDIRKTAEAGLALLEFLEGYEYALIIDSIMTRQHPPGTLLELHPDDFDPVESPSPHYAGLPDIMRMARRLEIDFPHSISILAMEIESPLVIQEGLTPVVQAALPEYIARARRILQDWIELPSTADVGAT